MTTGQTYGQALKEIASAGEERSASARQLLSSWDATDSRLRSKSVETQASVASASVSLGDPNSWRVSGFSPNDGSYWTSMILVIDGVYCSASGCSVTDHMQITTTVNPGVTASRINTNILYFPNNGGLTTRRWYLYAICRGGTCGNVQAIDNRMTFERSITHWDRSGGAPLTIALGVQVNTRYNTVTDGSKTADCYGRSGGDRRCFYR